VYTNVKKKLKPMIGRRIGNLIVLARDEEKYLCQCDCGEKKSFWRSNLIQGKKTHCGCMKYSDRDLTGKVFGRLTVVSKHNGSFQKWECGRNSISTSTNLRHGRSRSCGCLQREIVKEIGKANMFLTDEEREERRHRDDTLVKIWRLAVYERDNYTCQKCWVRGGELRAHHKDCWCDYPERRFEEENGVTLCVDCHNKIHKIYGKKTIEANWLEFLSLGV
jgi:hypothetical protein